MTTAPTTFAEEKRDQLPMRLQLGWGVGSLAMTLMHSANSVLLLRFLTDYVGIAAVTAGALIAASKLFDTAVDPLIGMASDRTKSRWGRRRPYILIGTILAVSSFWFMFSMPIAADMNTRILLVTATLMVNAFAYGLFMIPYLAMPAEMTTTPMQRTTLISKRVIFAAAGSATAAFAGPRVIAALGGGLEGHQVMAFVAGGLILTAGIACFLFTGNAARTVPPPKTTLSTKEQFKTVISNRPFVVLVATKLTNLLAVAMYQAITPFVFVTAIGHTYAEMSYYLLTHGLMTLFVQPLWVRFSRRFGKKRMFWFGTVFYVAGILSWLLAGPNDPWWLLAARGLLTGGGGGGMLLAGQSMLPDTIEHDYNRTGLRREGVLAGVYTTVEKLASAFAVSMTGVVLGAVGYIHGKGMAGAIQSPEVVEAIRNVLFLPAFFQIASCFVLAFYNLDDGRRRPKLPPPVTDVAAEQP
ncbi:MAG: MFS transporter [Phenylobacterium sp.]|nr:MFS transporter [Phenylobacterium sp.]